MKKVVLVIDKNHGTASLLSSLIKRSNEEIEVEIVDSRESTLKYYAGTNDEIILVIISNDNIRDPEVAMDLRKQGYEGRIIAYSGGSEKDWAIMKDDAHFSFCPKNQKSNAILMKIAVYTHMTPD